jgi:hypothetical protein
MSQGPLLQSLLAGKTPKNLRMLIARGLAPIPPNEMLELLVCLSTDNDAEVASQAAETISGWEQEEILTQLQNRDCPPAVLEYFAAAKSPDPVLQAILMNPSTPPKTIESLALTVPRHLLEAILDNRVRIIEFPSILENIRQNPSITPEIQRLVQEIEIEFLGSKKIEYAVETPAETESSQLQAPGFESEIPLQELSLEGLPVDDEARQEAILKRLSAMPVREKIRYALFGNREIRAVLIRDSNKEVARTVLHSPKLTDNEVESIAAMRSVAEDILREIGISREWTRSYGVVQNLVKNPKTPPVISQRLMFRLRSQDLTLMTRDRSIPDAVRHGATRILKQRTSTRPRQ